MRARFPRARSPAGSWSDQRRPRRRAPSACRRAGVEIESGRRLLMWTRSARAGCHQTMPRTLSQGPRDLLLSDSGRRPGGDDALLAVLAAEPIRHLVDALYRPIPTLVSPEHVA